MNLEAGLPAFLVARLPRQGAVPGRPVAPAVLGPGRCGAPGAVAYDAVACSARPRPPSWRLVFCSDSTEVTGPTSSAARARRRRNWRPASRRPDPAASQRVPGPRAPWPSKPGLSAVWRRAASSHHPLASRPTAAPTTHQGGGPCLQPHARPQQPVLAAAAAAVHPAPWPRHHGAAARRRSRRRHHRPSGFAASPSATPSRFPSSGGAPAASSLAALVAAEEQPSSSARAASSLAALVAAAAQRSSSAWAFLVSGCGGFGASGRACMAGARRPEAVGCPVPCCLVPPGGMPISGGSRVSVLSCFPGPGRPLFCPALPRPLSLFR